MLLKTKNYPKENPFWQSPRLTPNELYIQSEDYRSGIDNWAKGWRQPGPHKFHQVRYLGSKEQIKSRADWWLEGPWIDCIFWVFIKPYYSFPEGKPYGYYCLEFMECQRVIQYATERYGYSPFPSQNPMLTIPTELCDMCRFETTAGFSDHLRPREPVQLTQQEIDKEERAKEYVEKKIPEIEETVSNPKFKRLVEAEVKEF